eukprot:3051515-Prorocentrum_lima.AAC.1
MNSHPARHAPHQYLLELTATREQNAQQRFVPTPCGPGLHGLVELRAHKNEAAPRTPRPQGEPDEPIEGTFSLGMHRTSSHSSLPLA